MLALSRGGRYTIENIVPACRSCNASKSNDEVTRWLRRKKLDERAFLLRHREVLTLLRAVPGGRRRRVARAQASVRPMEPITASSG